MALCIPEACNEHDFLTVGNALTKLAQQQVPSMTTDVIDPLDLEFYYEKPAELISLYELGFMNYVYYTFIGVLVCMVIAGGSVDYYHSNADKVDFKTPEQEHLYQWYCFSPRFNLLVLANCEYSSELKAVIGLLFWTTIYGILGHTYNHGLGNHNYMNPYYKDEFFKTGFFAFTYFCYFGMDFFFLGVAWIITYMLMKYGFYSQCQNTSPTSMVMKGLTYLVIRFTVPVVITIGFIMYVWPFLFDGATKQYFGLSQYTVQCNEYWWTNILNINNIYPWGYYSQCYTPLFAFALTTDCSLLLLVILYTYKYIHKGMAYLTMVVLIGVQMYLTYFISLKLELSTDPLFDVGFKDNIYEKPWTRMSCFIIGIMGGLMFFENEHQKLFEGEMNLGKYYVKAFKLLPIEPLLYVGVAVYIVMVNVNVNHYGSTDTNANALYNMYRYPVVGFSTLLIVSSFKARRNRYLRFIFDNTVVRSFQFLLIPMYLCHLLVIDQYYISYNESEYLNHLGNVIKFSYFCLLIFVVSLGCFILFDGPLCNILEYYIFGIKKLNYVENKCQHNAHNFFMVKSGIKVYNNIANPDEKLQVVDSVDAKSRKNKENKSENSDLLLSPDKENKIGQREDHKIEAERPKHRYHQILENDQYEEEYVNEEYKKNN